VLQAAPDADPTLLEPPGPTGSDRPAAVGGRDYALEARPAPDGTTAVVLTARQEGHRLPVWETVLDRRVGRRPPRLRP